MASGKWSSTCALVMRASCGAIWRMQSPDFLPEVNQNIHVQPPVPSWSSGKRTEPLKILQSFTLCRWENLARRIQRKLAKSIGEHEGK